MSTVAGRSAGASNRIFSRNSFPLAAAKHTVTAPVAASFEANDCRITRVSSVIAIRIIGSKEAKNNICGQYFFWSI